MADTRVRCNSGVVTNAQSPPHLSLFHKAHATITGSGIAIRRGLTSKILAALIPVLSPQSHAQAQSHCFACNIVESGYLPDSVGEQLIFRSERVLAVGVRPKVQQVEVRFGTVTCPDLPPS